jgi:hypothetical protein
MFGVFNDGFVTSYGDIAGYLDDMCDTNFQFAFRLSELPADILLWFPGYEGQGWGRVYVRCNVESIWNDLTSYKFSCVDELGAEVYWTKKISTVGGLHILPTESWDSRCMYFLGRQFTQTRKLLAHLPRPQVYDIVHNVVTEDEGSDADTDMMIVMHVGNDDETVTPGTPPTLAALFPTNVLTPFSMAIQYMLNPEETHSLSDFLEDE